MDLLLRAFLPGLCDSVCASRRAPRLPLVFRALFPVAVIFALTLHAEDSALVSSRTPTLGLGIPSDCFFFLESKGDDRRDLFDTRMEELVASFGSDGLLEEVLSGLLGPELKESEGVTEELAVWRRILTAVEWKNLTGKEFAVGMRYDFPTIEVLGLFRVDPAARLRVASQMRRILYGLSAIGLHLEIQAGRDDGIETLVLQSTEDSQAQLCMSGRHDLIALSTSSKILRRSLRLLDGGSSQSGILLDESFSTAFSELDTPSAGFRLYVRPSAYFGHLRSLSEVLSGPGALASDPQAKRIREQLTAVLETLDFVENVAMVGAVSGSRLDVDFRLVLTDGARRSALYSAFGEQPPLPRLQTQVAAEVSSVVAWNGIDFQTVLRGLERLESVGYLSWFAEGKTLTQQREAHGGLDAFLDLLELIEGRVYFLGHETGGPLPLPVLRVQIGDGDAARDALARIVGWLRSEGNVSVKELSASGGKDTSFVLGVLGETNLLVVGVFGDELCLGQSVEGINSSRVVGQKDVAALKRVEAMGLRVEASQQFLSSVESASLRPWIEVIQVATRLAGWVAKGEGADQRSTFSLIVDFTQKLLDVVDYEGVSVYRVGDSYHGQWVLEARPESAEK